MELAMALQQADDLGEQSVAISKWFTRIGVWKSRYVSNALVHTVCACSTPDTRSATYSPSSPLAHSPPYHFTTISYCTQATLNDILAALPPDELSAGREARR